MSPPSFRFAFGIPFYPSSNIFHTEKMVQHPFCFLDASIFVVLNIMLSIWIHRPHAWVPLFTLSFMSVVLRAECIWVFFCTSSAVTSKICFAHGLWNDFSCSTNTRIEPLQIGMLFFSTSLHFPFHILISSYLRLVCIFYVTSSEVFVDRAMCLHFHFCTY